MNIARIAAVTTGVAVGVPALAIAALTVRSLVDQGSGHGAPESAQGPGSDWRSHLPGGPIRGTAVEASMLGARIAGWMHHQGRATPPRAIDDSLGQAVASWQALQQRVGVAGDRGMIAEAPDALMKPATVWPLGQALNAALDIAAHTGDYRDVNALFSKLSIYEADGAYAAETWTTGKHRFWDDNAWIALDMLQAWRQTGDQRYLKSVEEMMPFFDAGIRDDGGVWWQENNPEMSVNTCSTAPVEQVMLGMYEATGKQQYLNRALRIDRFLEQRLQREDGLYIDHIGADGRVNDAIWSYNQGTPIGASVQLYRITGDQVYLERAKRTADAVMTWAARGDTLWKQPPAFNAILFRNLLALDAVAPDPRYRTLLHTYLDRAWNEARDSTSGFFTKAGIGKYEDGSSGTSIDQAAMVQMFAMLTANRVPEGDAR